MLIGGAAAVDHVRRMAGKGVAGHARVDWAELVAFKRAFTDPVPAKNEACYVEKGIDAFKGSARFFGPGAVDVEGVGKLNARRFMIASGAEPAKLGTPDEEHLPDNEGFLGLEKLPARIAMVGGGYIAAEFSHIAARAGARVTIFQHADRPLTTSSRSSWPGRWGRSRPSAWMFDWARRSTRSRSSMAATGSWRPLQARASWWRWTR